MIVCPITSAENMYAEFQVARSKRPDFLEFRTDLLPIEKFEEVSLFAKENDFRLILTAKNLHHGIFDMNEVFVHPDLANVEYIDLDFDELKTSDIGDQLFKMLFSLNVKMIVSHHIFRNGENTPENSGDIPQYIEKMNEMERCRAQILNCYGFHHKMLIKFAYEVCSEEEAERFCLFAGDRKNFVVVPMGKFGKPYRLKLYRDNPLSYAYLCSSNAPGQPSVEEYRNYAN